MLKILYKLIKISKKKYLVVLMESEGKYMKKNSKIRIKNRVQKLMNLIWGL